MGCSTIAYLLDTGLPCAHSNSAVLLIELSIPIDPIPKNATRSYTRISPNESDLELERYVRSRRRSHTRIRPNESDLELERHVRSRPYRPVFMKVVVEWLFIGEGFSVSLLMGEYELWFS
jgi:hypothetical protein